MAPPCSICSHLDRDEIDCALVGTETLVAIAKRFHITRDSLARHRDNHLTPAVVRLAMARRNDASAVSILDQVEELVVRTNRFIDKAERKGALVAGAQLLGQMRQSLELIAKLTGELDDKPTVNVLNVAASPDWLALRAAILTALAPFPAARNAVVQALTMAQPLALEAGE